MTEERLARRAIEARKIETEFLRQQFWDAVADVAPMAMREIFAPETFADPHYGVEEAVRDWWVEEFGVWPYPHAMTWFDRYGIDSLMLQLDVLESYGRAWSTKTTPDRIIIVPYAEILAAKRARGAIERSFRLPLDTTTPYGSAFIWNPLHETRKAAEARIIFEFTAMLSDAMNEHAEACADLPKGPSEELGKTPFGWGTSGAVVRPYVKPPKKRTETHFVALARVQFLHETREEVTQALELNVNGDPKKVNRLTERVKALADAIGLTPYRAARGPNRHK